MASIVFTPLMIYFFCFFAVSQARVHAEMDEIFKGSNRQCTFQDTLEMKYLERVIMETLRIFPPVPAIARQLNEDVKLGNYSSRGTLALLRFFSPFFYYYHCLMYILF